METITAGLDLMPVFNEILLYAVGGLVGMGMWLFKAAIKKMGFEADKTQIDRVREALNNGLIMGKSYVLEKAEGAGMNNVLIKNNIALMAAKYAAKQVPSAVKKMGYTPEQLRNWASTVLEKENSVPTPPKV